MTDGDVSLALAPVRQQLYSAPVADLEGAVRAALAQGGLEGSVRPGQRIAITAGSRGIANIAAVLRTVAARVRELGAEPFIVPAMGSHGGATDEGQRELLAGTFGIDEVRAGAPVLSSMEVVELGRTAEHDLPVYLDRNAAGADGIVVVNRVKPHTDFTGPYESGLMKMITIGLGKRLQAESIHAYGAWGLRVLMPEVARAKLEQAKILLGVALLEDGHDQTCEVVGLPAAAIPDEEPRLLERARRNMARLPFEELDLLIVDRIGKEISGAGMDPNVIGRKRIDGEPEFTSPRIERIIARELSRETHGNGIGTGLADIITQRLFDGIDWEITNTNSVVSGFTLRSMVPVIAANDREALRTALFLLRRHPLPGLRVARILDTFHLEHLQVSLPLLDGDAASRIEPQGPAAPLRFDGEGNLL
jgi:Lactate racemase N-terminal domain